MKKIRGVLMLVTLLVLLVGVVNASEVSDTATTTSIEEVQETNIVSHHDTISQENKWDGNIRTDERPDNNMNEEKNKTLKANTENRNIKEETGEQTVQSIVKNKQKSVKTSSSYDVETFQELRDALTNSDDEYITVNIKDNIKLKDNITVQSLDVASHMYVTINGEGKTIDGDHQHYFLNIYSPLLEVTINNLTINNCTGAPSLVDGSPLTAGGAIRNYATLILNNTRFNNNNAELYGGAIWNFNTLIVDNTEFNNNTVHSEHGESSGIELGGAIYNHENGATLIVNNTLFNNNKAKFGGAIYSDSCNLILDNTQFNNNHANNAGGAIFTGGSSPESQYPSHSPSSSPTYLTVSNTVFENNTADREGGAISNGGALTVVNTRFNNNNAYGQYIEYDEIIDGFIMSGGYGGAISHACTGTLNVTNSEFNNNHADNYGGAISTDGNLTVTKTQFNYNTANSWGGAIYYSNGTYNITDTTFNKNTPANFVINQDNYIDLEETDNYINVSNLAILVDGIEIYNGVLYLEQDHTSQAFCDMGEGNHLVKLIVNGTNIINNEYILSDIIDITYQNLNHVLEVATTDTTIKLIGELPYNILETITLDKPGITITIEGNGQTINGMQNQVFNIKGGSSLVLKNITITNATAIRGGAIYNDGNLTITDCTITNNQATASGEKDAFGGAICNNGNLTITNSTITNNQATASGDEDALGGAIWNNGNLTITDCTITNNQVIKTKNEDMADAYSHGGAIYNLYGRITINNSTFTYNKALTTVISTAGDSSSHAMGGAIFNAYGILTITDSSLNNNLANATGVDASSNARGGAIYNDDGILTITDSILTNNQANPIGVDASSDARGGAIYNKQTNINITNTIFYNNTPANFIINETTKNIESINNDGYISIPYFTIIADAEEIGTGTNIDDLKRITILDEYKNVEILLKGTDEKTLNNRFILRKSNVEVHNYTELVNAIEKAQHENTDNNMIYLLPGDYNATRSINWEESETKNLIINGNNHIIDGKNIYQFIKVGSGLNLTLKNVNLRNFNAENGGAIHNLGHLTIINSSFTKNSATNSGGAIYSENILNITVSNFIQNTASTGAAINYNGNTIYLRRNMFTQNTASIDGETLKLMGETVTLEDNIYNSTDIAFKTVNLSLKDNQQYYLLGKNVELNFTIELEHQESYDANIQEKLDKTIYINEIKNVTTKYENYTLSNLELNEYTIIYHINHNKSNTVTFKVVNVIDEVSTPEKEYDYYEGIKNTVPIEIKNPSREKGTLDISVKEDNKYQQLLTYHNVKDGYTFTTEALKDALENLYDNLDNSYIINITYTANYVTPTSTKFTLNIIKQRNTTIIYDIINNTEGNVQINITLTDTVSKTPINNATIKITGDITQTTTTGIITYTTLTPNTYTISVLYNETDNYKPSEATINFKVEIDKDKKIKELEKQLENLKNTIKELNNTFKEQTNTINTLNNTIKNLNNTIKEQTTTINTLTNTIKNLNKTIKQQTETIKNLNNTIQKQTSTIHTLNTTINNLTKQLTKANNEIKTLNNTINNLNNKLNNANREINTINNTNKKITQELNNANKKINTLTNTNKKLTTQLTEANKKIDKLTQKIEKLTNKTKLNTTITINPKKSRVGSIVKISANIKDQNGKVVNDGRVIFKINGKTLRDENNNILYALVSNGTASINYKVKEAWLKNNTTIQVTYAGSQKYASSKNSSSSALIITKGKATLTLDQTNIKAKTEETITLRAKVLDGNGERINSSQVIFKVNGKTLTDKNGKQVTAKVVDGDAILKYTIPTSYSSKTYNLSAIYGGSYEHTETTGKLNIERKTVTINRPVIKTKNGKTFVKASITDENGLLLAGKTKLAIKVGGKTVLNNVTSINGKIDVSFITSLKHGMYELLIISGENSRYQSGRLTTILKI